jgi:GntR family transcriptional regulator
MLTIRLDAAESLVDQIARGIRVLLASGTLKPNDELPTVRQLAGDLGVNLNTVSRAYRELEEAGLVTSVRGRGTVVASDQELLRGGKARKKRELVDRLASIFADAKLAGLSDAEVDSLVAEQRERFRV